MGLENNRHLRIIDPAASDDFIARRLDAINRLKLRIRKRPQLREQLAFAAKLVDGLLSRDLAEPARRMTAESITSAAPSFVDDGSKGNELSVIFALACGEAVPVAKASAQEPQMRLLAQAMRLGLSYPAPFVDQPREALRQDLLAAVSKYLEPTAEAERHRLPIPVVTADNALSAIQALDRNAKWDREEIDLLWWVITDWSEIADQRVSDMPAEMACIVSALETSALFAGSAAQGLRNVTVRHISNSGQTRSPAAFIEGSTGARAWARRALASARAEIHASPTIFPALTIATLDDGPTNADLLARVSAGAELKLVDWCRRLVIEIELIKKLGHKVSVTPGV